jgi:hypothetical protein
LLHLRGVAPESSDGRSVHFQPKGGCKSNLRLTLGLIWLGELINGWLERFWWLLFGMVVVVKSQFSKGGPIDAHYYSFTLC